jgi:hypothetical protein
MRKFFYLITVIIISVALSSCGAKKPSQVTASNAATNGKITYSKEITYFPSYNEVNSAVKSTQFTPASKKNPFATARYKIPNTTDAQVYADYEAMLKRDGWTITKDQKYFSISAKKDKHMSNILIQKAGKDILLVVIAK